MKIAVTGASGYLGHFVLNGLKRAGHDVLALSRQPCSSHDHVEYQLGDAPDIAGMDAVVHCAFSHVPGKYRGGEGDDPDGFRMLNVDGSITLFQAAKAQGINRLVFLSSRAVYGPQDGMLREDTPCAPRHPLWPDQVGGRSCLVGPCRCGVPPDHPAGNRHLRGGLPARLAQMAGPVRGFRKRHCPRPAPRNRSPW